MEQNGHDFIDRNKWPSDIASADFSVLYSWFDFFNLLEVLLMINNNGF